MAFHANLIDSDIHTISAKTYADLAARNDDAAFQIAGNVNKVVRVDTVPPAYYTLVEVGPTMWCELTNTSTDALIKLNDTPASYSGQAGNVLQVNALEDATEFGQALTSASSPQFDTLTLTGDLTVQGTTTTIDTTTLEVEDNNIEIGTVTTPTDITADGGGITLKGATDKIISWVQSTLAWTFNQRVLVQDEVSIGSLVAPATDSSLDLKATDKALLLNRLTTIQRDALTPIAGMEIYNTDNNRPEAYNGSAWISLTAAGGDIVGPVSSTDNAVVRFDGTTGKVVKNTTGLFVLDTGEVGVGLDNPTVPLDVVGDAAISGSTTLGGEAAARHSSVVTEVFSASDLPAPVSGVITLPSGTYVIKADISISDRIEIGSGSTVAFFFESPRNNTLTYTGTDTFLTGLNATRIDMTCVNIVMSGNNATALDITGGSFNFTESQLSMSGTGAKCGSLTNVFTAIIRNFNISGFEFGLILTDVGGVSVASGLMSSSLIGTDAQFIFLNDVSLFVTIQGLLSLTGASESIFFIDPIIHTGGFNIINTINAGAGTFFKAGVTGPIASFTDVSTAATASTVTDNVGQALFSSATHGLNIGETVVHTTFTEASYNGTFIVTAVTVGTYEVGLAFVSTDSGLFSTTTTQVNDVAHGLSNGTDISIFDTINFHGGYSIFNVQTDTFEITLGAAFPGTETGTWDTGSQDQTSEHINAQNNGAQEDSHSTAFGHTNANATATTIALIDTYQAMDVGTMEIVAESTARWTLVDATAGVFRYDGIDPFVGSLNITIAAVKSSTTKNFRFTIAIDGAMPPFVGTFYAPMEVRTTKVVVPALKPVMVLPGQTVQLVVAEEGFTDDITITDVVLNIVD